MNEYEQGIVNRALVKNPTKEDSEAYKKLKLSPETVTKHDNALIKNWNQQVGPEDSVYHLGDFAWGTYEHINNIIDRLNGKIYFIFGNHDKEIRRNTEHCKFQWAKEVYELKTGQHTYFLSHYAHLVWNKSHHGARHLFGHSHGTIRLPRFCQQCGSGLTVDYVCGRCGFSGWGAKMDVGVDCNDYRPISIDEIERKLSSVTKSSIDHH